MLPYSNEEDYGKKVPNSPTYMLISIQWLFYLWLFSVPICQDSCGKKKNARGIKKMRRALIP